MSNSVTFSTKKEEVRDVGWNTRLLDIMVLLLLLGWDDDDDEVLFDTHDDDDDDREISIVYCLSHD